MCFDKTVGGRTSKDLKINTSGINCKTCEHIDNRIDYCIELDGGLTIYYAYL